MFCGDGKGKVSDSVKPGTSLATLEKEVTDRLKWKEPEITLKIIDRDLAHVKSEIAAGRLSAEQGEKFFLKVRYARISALVQQGNMREAIWEYENLGEIKMEISPQTMVTVADAYLYLHHPGEALVLYEEALRQQWDPNGSTRMARHYALVELGRYEDAGEILTELDKEMPAQTLDSGVLQDNWYKEDVAYNRS